MFQEPVVIAMKVKKHLGATYMGDGHCYFLVWAPLVQKMEVHFTVPEDRTVSLKRDRRGYHQGMINEVIPGSLYFYQMDGIKQHPDPASHFQPYGVHGPSQVVDDTFQWNDNSWVGLSIEKYIIYELHVGTFTQEGTFKATISYLEELRQLGITALELMPVAQFPGNRNWGYDGVYPFAVQNSYGGPNDLKTLINACHQNGLAVILDTVYNHFGPEGNYNIDFGPYFTDRYKTPWGAAINFDGPYSDEVRRFFIENAVYWLTDFHIDALRLDAVHAIIDNSASTFLEELSEACHHVEKMANRKIYLIGESDANNVRFIMAQNAGGYGLDAQWNDDFHHSLHTILTGEQNGYYRDFGKPDHLIKAFQEGFVYSGQYSFYRKRQHGVSSSNTPATHFVVYSQNHDQIGNRSFGERLSQLVSFEAYKLAAGITLLSPFIPLIFMGEEYGETAPFLYFTSHTNSQLIEAVRQGRMKEFKSFHWLQKPPDPQNEATFSKSKLNWQLHSQNQHSIINDFYRRLITLRKDIPALSCLSKDNMNIKCYPQDKFIIVHRWDKNSEVVILFSINEDYMQIASPLPEGYWYKRLDSADKCWGGKGTGIPCKMCSSDTGNFILNPWSFVLFIKEV
jgi:maltooligosyltrehalose trehalohydrolase